MDVSHSTRVRDIMIKRVITINQDSTARDAGEQMRDESVGLLVVSKGKKPVGVVTREDIINKVVSLDKLPSEVPIRDIMSSDIVSCSPDDDLSTVSKKMVKHGYERMPVVSMGQLIGLVSDREILKTAPSEIEILRERLLMEPPTAGEETTSGVCELCGNESEELANVNDRWVCDACKEEAAEL